jgi:hypothetical protein
MTSNHISVKKNIENITAFRDFLNSVLNDYCLNPLDATPEPVISFLGTHLQKIFSKLYIKDNLFITDEQKNIVLSALDFTPNIKFVNIPSSSDDSDNISVGSLGNESDCDKTHVNYDQYRTSPQYSILGNDSDRDKDHFDYNQYRTSPQYSTYKNGWLPQYDAVQYRTQSPIPPRHTNTPSSLDDPLAQLKKPVSPTTSHNFDELDKMIAELDKTKKSDDLQTQFAIELLENTIDLNSYHYLKTANMKITCKFLEDTFLY